MKIFYGVFLGALCCFFSFCCFADDEIRIPLAQFTKGNRYVYLPENDGTGVSRLNRIDYLNGIPYYARVSRRPENAVSVRETRAELLERVYNKYGKPIKVDLVGIPLVGLLYGGLSWSCNKLRGDVEPPAQDSLTSNQMERVSTRTVEDLYEVETNEPAVKTDEPIEKGSTFALRGGEKLKTFALRGGEKMKAALGTVAIGFAVKDFVALYKMVCEMYKDERMEYLVTVPSQQEQNIVQQKATSPSEENNPS